MDYQSHIGLVDPHPKSVGAYHDPDFVLNPILLSFAPLIMRQTCVIKGGGNAFIMQPLRDVFHGVAGISKNQSTSLRLGNQSQYDLLFGGCIERVES